jgi:8-oxo-dGTP diphosphatase
VCRASGGDLAAQLEEVSDLQWVSLGDLTGLQAPAELPALADAAVRWAKACR